MTGQGSDSKEGVYKFNEDDAYEHLYHICFHCGHDDWLEIRIIPREKGKTIIKWFKTPEDAVEWITDNWHKLELYNKFVYVSLNPRTSLTKPKGPGNSKMVTHGYILYADLDYKKQIDKCEQQLVEGNDHELRGDVVLKNKCYRIQRPPLSKVVAKHKELLGIEPSLVIDSGYGYHVYLFMAHPLPADEWKRMEELYIEVLGGDKAKDLARIVSLAGTLNVKSDTPRRVAIIYRSPNIEQQHRPDPMDVYEKLLEVKEKIANKETNTVETGFDKDVSTTKQQQGTKTGKEVRKKQKILKEKEINKIVETLKQYWIPGHRNNLQLGLVGWMIKEGIPLENAKQIVEALGKATGDEELDKRLAEVERQYRLVAEGRKKLEELLGKTGILAELQAVIKEQNPSISDEESRDRALAVVHVLETLLGWRRSILIMTIYESGTYIVNDPKRGIVLLKIKIKNDGSVSRNRKYISDWYIRKVMIVKGDGQYVYKVLFKNARTKEKLMLAGSLDEIIKELKRLHGVKRSQYLGDAVSAVISEFIRRKLAKVKRTAAVAGILPVRDTVKLVRTGALSRLLIPKEVDVEKAKQALELLQQLRKHYDPAKFDVAINWAGYAVASYALKKQYHVKQVYLLLHGKQQTGKTTLARIITAMFPVVTSEAEEIPEEGQSEFRLAWKLNVAAVPLLEDEIQGISRKPSLLGLLKRASTGDTVRWRGDQNRRYHARAPLVFTSNFTELIEDPALIERIISVEFTQNDYVFNKPREQREQFKRIYTEYRSIAHHLGAVLLQVIEEYWQYIANEWVHRLQEKTDYLQFGQQVWKWVAEKLGVKIPEWAIHSIELKAVEDPDEKIREVFWEIIENEIKTKLLQARLPPTKNAVEAIQMLDKNSLLPPWMKLKEDKILITYGIVPEIRKKQLEINNLKQLGDKLNYPYKPVRVGKRVIKAIVIPSDDINSNVAL